MRKLGYSVVALGAVFWITIGALAFSQNMKTDPSRSAAGAILAYGYYYGQDDGWGNVADDWNYPGANPRYTYAPATVSDTFWNGPYYSYSYTSAAPRPQIYQGSDGTYSVVDDNSPWYVRSFPGYGNLVQTLVPGLNQQTAASPVVYTIVPQAPAKPACTIQVDPGSVPYGGRAILHWISSDADSAILQGVGSVSPSSSFVLNSLTTTRTYVLSVFGRGGSATCATMVSVEPLVSKAPSCIIAANPTILARGQQVSVSWGSENAASAYLDGVGAVPTTGGTSFTPSAPITYTLTVQSISGERAACAASVKVQ